MEVTPPAFAVCTIVASNYLARVLVLHDSLRRQHSGMSFWMLLIDDAPLAPLALAAMERRGVQILRVGEIGLPPGEIANFRMIYDITEISTAYKPWTMETVVKRTGLHVFYIDPDIEFFAPMNSLVDAVATHDLVLTPHVVRPMKRDGAQPSESDIMGSGIYNLGFLGMNRDALKVTAWWSERLLRECYSAPAQQRFTDQRWMDFAPALFNCHISKDETFNVAYWNADERPIVIEGDSYFVHGKPLSFFHYSGLDERAPHLLTRHHAGCPRVLLSRHPALATLTEHYIRALATAQEECKDATADYPFNEFPGGGKISPGIRRAFLRELVAAEKEGRTPPPSPFGPGGEDAFIRWATEMVLPDKSGQSIPRLALALRGARDDLMQAFPEPGGRDATRLVEWIRNEGRKQFKLPLRLLPQSIIHQKPRNAKSLVPGVEVIGYLKTESGVGEAARLLTQCLSHSTIPFVTRVDRSAPSRQNAPFGETDAAGLKEGEAYDCCVLCVNADSVASVRRRFGNDYFRKRHVVGLWFWELEAFPGHLHSAFREVDEVWVATEFIRQTLAPISPVPVHHVILPLGAGAKPGPLDRAAIGIPEGRFFFLFSFDFHSIFRRKNSVGLVEAFSKAFQEGEGPLLVIKGINGEAHVPELEQLRHAARGRKDIIILSQYLDSATNQALTASCDCYVSLHRSEGLGLTMAEAMRHGKPVVATAYSGNMDFMNEENSYLCRYSLTEVGPGCHPYPPTDRWAEPDIGHATELMRQVYSHPEEARRKGQLAAEELASRFSPEHCAAALQERCNALRSGAKDGRNALMEVHKSQSTANPVKSLRKQALRPLDLDNTVPSSGSFLFQGPHKVLTKLLRRVEKHRKPFDDAVVAAASDHEGRLAELEKAIADLRQQNAALLNEVASLHSSSDAAAAG